VTFTAEELKALEEESTGTVEITEFVPDEKIDPIYYDKAYFLAPDKGGAKPYALLSEGMRSTGRCALARWAARGKQYLVQIRPVEDGLIMQQLLYADEVRSIKDIEIQEATVKDAELKLAVQLIEQIAEDEFNPKQYEDDVRKRIEAAVEKKISGKEISISPEAPAAKGGAQVIDLMGALRASLTKGVPKRTEAQRKPAKRAAAVATPLKKANRR
jgi:DNA end-binding protein Ku